MSLILDGTNGETFPSWTTATRPSSPTAGQVGYNSSLGILESYNGSIWIAGGLPTPSTSGNLLTSDGTNWTSATASASGGMTLLGTITPTAVNSVSLGSLVLTSYKQVQIVINNISNGVTTGAGFTFSSDNNQTQKNVTNDAKTTRGIVTIDLGTGTIGAGVITTQGGTQAAALAGGSTNIATSSTTIYIRMNSTNTFDAVGSFVIYGVK